MGSNLFGLPWGNEPLFEEKLQQRRQIVPSRLREFLDRPMKSCGVDEALARTPPGKLLDGKTPRER